MIKIKGLIAASYTPFDNKGQLDVSLIPTYANVLKKSGVSGVFINGTTGEGASLTTSERIASANAWIKEKSDKFLVIVHVGHNSLMVSRELAAHAKTIQADGIGSMAPYFYKPTDIYSLVYHNAAIANAAPELPYFYYHIPSMTGVNFQMIDFLPEAEKQIPNLAGIKFTHDDLMDMKLCLEFANGKYNILHGRDEFLISGLVLGVQGAIGSTYNYMAPLYVKILDAFNRLDLKLANKLQHEAIKIIKVLIKYGGGVKAGKSFMRCVGIDCGSPRLPVIGLTQAEEAQLNKELQALRFHDHCIDFSIA